MYMAFQASLARGDALDDAKADDIAGLAVPAPAVPEALNAPMQSAAQVVVAAGQACFR